MRSGTTLLARDVSRSILRAPLLPEITPLSEIAAVTAKWRAYEASRSATWLRSESQIDDFLLGAFVSLLSSGIHSMSSGERERALGICIKDPRLALFPDEVLRVVRKRGVALLVIVRNPMAVLASAYRVLQARDRQVDVDALEAEIWHSFVGIERLLTALPSEDVLSAVIRYEEYCLNPEFDLRRVSEILGVALPAQSPDKELDDVLARMDRHDPFLSSMLEEPAAPKEESDWRVGLPEHLTERFSTNFSGVLHRLGYSESQ